MTSMAAAAVLALVASAAIASGRDANGAQQQQQPLETTTNINDSVPAGPTLDIKTTAGDIKIRLYDDTPQHRDNFLKLAKEGFYDGVLFHRVIDGFMVQTGDPNRKERLRARCSGRATLATLSWRKLSIPDISTNMVRSQLHAQAML